MWLQTARAITVSFCGVHKTPVTEKTHSLWTCCCSILLGVCKHFFGHSQPNLFINHQFVVEADASPEARFKCFADSAAYHLVSGSRSYLLLPANLCM